MIGKSRDKVVITKFAAAKNQDNAGAARAIPLLVCLSVFLAVTFLPFCNVVRAQDLPLAIGQTTKSKAAQAPASKPFPIRLTELEKEIETKVAAFKHKGITDQQLQELRPKLEPMQAEAQAIQDAFDAQQKAAKARLDQLGPLPKEGAPAEAASVAAQRQKLKSAFDEADGLFKRAKVTLVRIRQLEDDITNKRRAILQSILLKRSRSALHPVFWFDLLRDIPVTAGEIGQVLGTWFGSAGAVLNKGNWLRFLVFLFGIGVLGLVLWKVSRQILPRRESVRPADFEKVVAAVWVAAVVFAVPTLIAWALFEGLKLLKLIPLGTEVLATSLLYAVQKVALTAGLVRGILAPAKSEWRLINIETIRARRLAQLAVRAMVIIASMRVIDVLFNMTAASLVMSQALIVVGSLAVAILIAVTLYGTASVASQMDAELGPVVDAQPTFLGLWRLAIWLAVLTILGANIVGYFNVADFMVGQIVRVGFILVMAFLLIRLVSTGCARALDPNSFAGNLALATFGMQRSALKQISIIVIGAFRLVIYIAAGVALVAPLGVETVTIASTLNVLFFGFDIGGIRISFTTALIAIGLLVGGYLVAKAFQQWLEQSYLPHTSLDGGLQNSISTSAKYLGIFAAIAFSLGYLGLNFEKLAFVAGALSLGIGFGLQAIVSNFVSGLILLWERSIKVGDWVVVGSDEGYVRRINVRSTEIETFERQMVILPNSNLMTGVVKNWVRNNQTGRIAVPVGVSYDSDPDQVREVLLACASTHELVMENPKPYVVFQGFGDSSLDFELRAFISNVDSSLTVRSHLRFEIFRRFKEAGIEIPFPQRDLNLRDFDKLARLIGKNGSGSGTKPDSSE